MELKNKRRVGRPALESTKISTTIRLSPEVIENFKAAGDGWQTRIDLALKDWIKNNNPNKSFYLKSCNCTITPGIPTTP
jgi:uncharacterized protein (DUF4415 family)